MTDPQLSDLEGFLDRDLAVAFGNLRMSLFWLDNDAGAQDEAARAAHLRRLNADLALLEGRASGLARALRHGDRTANTGTVGEGNDHAPSCPLPSDHGGPDDRAEARPCDDAPCDHVLSDDGPRDDGQPEPRIPDADQSDADPAADPDGPGDVAALVASCEPVVGAPAQPDLAGGMPSDDLSPDAPPVPGPHAGPRASASLTSSDTRGLRPEGRTRAGLPPVSLMGFTDDPMEERPLSGDPPHDGADAVEPAPGAAGGDSDRGDAALAVTLDAAAEMGPPRAGDPAGRGAPQDPLATSPLAVADGQVIPLDPSRIAPAGGEQDDPELGASIDALLEAAVSARSRSETGELKLDLDTLEDLLGKVRATMA